MLRYSHIEKEEAEEMYLTYTKQRRSCEINIVVDLNTAYTKESPTEFQKCLYPASTLRKTNLLDLEQWFSKCGTITWELVKNADFQAHPNLVNQKF